MKDDPKPPPLLLPAAPPTRRSRLSPVTYAGMFLLALLMWLPFSFKTTGLIEEWGLIRTIDSGSQLFFTTPHSGLSQARLRPLLAFVHATAHALDPDSFLFFNVFQLLFLFGKMVAACWLVLQFLPRHRLLAFVTGVLFVVYPADTGMFSLRAIQIQAAVCSYLFAAYLLIRFVRPAHAAWLYLAGAAVLLMFSLMTYQIALPLAILTPLTALAFRRASDRRLWIAAAAWYGAIAIPAVYAYWALGQGAGITYEMSLLGVSTVAASSPLADVIGAVGLAYERQATGWATAWHGLGQYPHLRAGVLAGLFVFAGTGAWIAHDERHDWAGRPASARRYLIVAVVAIAIVGLGMAVFLALPTHRRQDFRIYFLSMLGSALVLALLLFWISRAVGRFRQAVFLTLALPFVGLGYTYALQNHQHYVNYSLLQQQILQDTVAQAPGLAANSFVVFLDRTGSINNEYAFYYGYYLGTGLKYLYADPSIDAGYCPLTSPGEFGTTCTFDASSLHITRSKGLTADEAVPYDRVVLLTNDVDDHFRLVSPNELAAIHELSGYDPQARIADSSPPPRAATMFSCEPALSCYGGASPSVASFDLPDSGPIGRGWRAAEPDDGGGTFRWSLTVSPSVSVDLANDADLALEFRISMWLEPEVVDSLTLSINGTAIPLTYELSQPKGRLYHGVLPREVLARSSASTDLVFRVNRLAPVPTAPDVKLGIALSSLRIRPRSR